MSRLYLEISSIGAACGKNKFEPIEKVLLLSWARHCPDDCKNYLVSKGYINLDDSAKDTLLDHDKILSKKAKTVSFNNTNTKDFQRIIKEGENELKQTRKAQGVEVTKDELLAFRENSEKTLHTSFGKNSEDGIIKNVNGKTGNDKMYYYNLSDRWCFGGKHDATVDDIVIEIKTRMKEFNVRKNEYDLYQMFGYLLAMKATKGKIIQQYNQTLYDSEFENQKEYGIIKLENYNVELGFMIQELHSFFEKLETIIENKCMTETDIQIAIPDNKPICTISKTNLVNKNSKYVKLFNFFVRY